MSSSPKPASQTICDAAVVAMAFNKDRTLLAFSPNNHLIHVVDCSKAGADCSQWPIVDTLESHGQNVAAIAWDHEHNRILSAAHDRTAFVWDLKGGRWAPVLILLDSQMKRGFTAAAWSHLGTKLYVASATGAIAVGKFDSADDWWRCSTMEPHCSAVTALAPHPSINSVLASGGADFRVTFASTFNKTLDGPENKLAKLGAQLGSVVLTAWVDALVWGPSGQWLMAATRDSRVTVVHGADPRDFSGWAAARSLDLHGLPMRALLPLSDTEVVCGGYDMCPVVLETESAAGDAEWAVTKAGTEKKKEVVKTGAAAAREKFQSQASFGTEVTIELPRTRHTNTIVGVCSVAGAPHMPGTAFATSSLDGRVELWKLDSLLPVEDGIIA